MERQGGLQGHESNWKGLGNDPERKGETQGGRGCTDKCEGSEAGRGQEKGDSVGSELYENKVQSFPRVISSRNAQKGSCTITAVSSRDVTTLIPTVIITMGLALRDTSFFFSIPLTLRSSSQIGATDPLHLTHSKLNRDSPALS